MGFGIRETLCRDLSESVATGLTYSEKHHHAEHGQQGGDDHAEEDRQFPGLVAWRLSGVARVLLPGLRGRRWPQLGFIYAGGEPVVKKRSPLCHHETRVQTSFTTPWSTLKNVTPALVLNPECLFYRQLCVSRVSSKVTVLVTVRDK